MKAEEARKITEKNSVYTSIWLVYEGIKAAADKGRSYNECLSVSSADIEELKDNGYHITIVDCNKIGISW